MKSFIYLFLIQVDYISDDSWIYIFLLFIWLPILPDVFLDVCIDTYFSTNLYRYRYINLILHLYLSRIWKKAGIRRQSPILVEFGKRSRETQQKRKRSNNFKKNLTRSATWKKFGITELQPAPSCLKVDVYFKILSIHFSIWILLLSRWIL